jgi:hypothetical protein
LIINCFDGCPNRRIVNILLYYLFILYLFLIFDWTMLLLLWHRDWRFAPHSTGKDIFFLLGLEDSG